MSGIESFPKMVDRLSMVGWPVFSSSLRNPPGTQLTASSRDETWGGDDMLPPPSPPREPH